PGLSAAIAAPELAGIPVTHRGVASGFVVVSGHDRATYEPLLGVLPPAAMTVVVLMGMRTRVELAAFLLGLGWRPTTPAAVIVNASQPDQHVWTGVLSELGGEAAGERADGPSAIVIGDVASAAALPHEIQAFLAGEDTWQSMTIQQQ